MEHGAYGAPSMGNRGMIHSLSCAAIRSLLAAGWLLGVAPLKSPSSCETCRVLGARLLHY